MTKYHITKKGEPGVCKAQEGNCPLGSSDEHYFSKEEAMKASEKINEELFSVLVNASDAVQKSNDKEQKEYENLLKKASKLSKVKLTPSLYRTKVVYSEDYAADFEKVVLNKLSQVKNTGFYEFDRYFKSRKEEILRNLENKKLKDSERIEELNKLNSLVFARNSIFDGNNQVKKEDLTTDIKRKIDFFIDEEQRKTDIAEFDLKNSSIRVENGKVKNHKFYTNTFIQVFERSENVNTLKEFKFILEEKEKIKN